MPRPPRILELEGRRICSGFYDIKDGQLRSLSFRTLGEEPEALGSHEPSGGDRNLIEYPPSSELQLTHLSGNEEPDNLSVVFNYE